MHLTLNEAKAITNQTRNDPIAFAEKVLKCNLWQKEREIFLSVRDHPETSVRSCHASGKTYTAARVVHWWLHANKDSVVITTAPTFRQVKEILWREIKSSIRPIMYESNQILDTRIDIDEKWFALGLATDRPDQFQGFHSPHLLVIIDEASGVAPNIYEAIDGLAAERILMLGNPLQLSGRFADSFRQPSVHKITISAYDTPNIQQGGVVIPGLITQKDIDKIKLYYGEDSDVYRVRVLGEFPLGGTDTLIGVDEVAKAIDRQAEVKGYWERLIGVDPARFGDDRTVITVRQMEKILHKEIFSGQDLMQTVGHTLRIANDFGVMDKNVFVDSIGIGAGVVDRLNEQGWHVNGVNVGLPAEDSEHYANVKAEVYNKVKEWLKTADLPDDDYYELANIKYKFNSKGQMLLESKDDLKKRGLPSPDVADSLALTFAKKQVIFYQGASEPIKGYYPEYGI